MRNTSLKFENNNERIAEVFVELIKNSAQLNDILTELRSKDINLYTQTGYYYFISFLNKLLIKQGEDKFKVIETIDMLSKLHSNFGNYLANSLNDARIDLLNKSEEITTSKENKYKLTEESYTQSRLSKVLGIHESTIISLVNQDKLKVIKTGKAKNSHVYYMRNDVIDFLDKNAKYNEIYWKNKK